MAASTGFVGKTASEYWGFDQAVLALVIWAKTKRVTHYPRRYDVPLHLLGGHHEVLAGWTAEDVPAAGVELAILPLTVPFSRPLPPADGRHDRGACFAFAPTVRCRRAQPQPDSTNTGRN